MDQMTVLLALLVSFPEAVLVAALGLVLVDVRPRFQQLLFLGLGQAGAAFLIRLTLIPFGAHTLLLALVFILLIHLIVRVDWRVASIAGLLGITIYGAVETATVPLLLHVTGYSLAEVILHPYLRVFFFLAEALILLFFIWLCLRLNFKLLGPPVEYGDGSDEWRFLSKSYFPVYLLAVLPVLLLVTLNMAFVTAESGVFPERHLPVFHAAMSLAVLVLTALTPMKIRAVGHVVARASAARKATENVTNIANLLRLVRRQQHDFRHQLQTVYGLLESGFCEEARQYIEKAYHTLVAPLELVRTDNLHVTALLYTKLTLAQSRNVRLELAVEGSIADLPLDPLEIASLFGNLIDNAIEAVENAPQDQRVVRVEITQERGNYVIVVSNRGSLQIPEKKRTGVFRIGYTTKKGHAGLGLANVREIVIKHGGVITASSDESETVFRVVLPCADPPDTLPVEGDQPND